MFRDFCKVTADKYREQLRNAVQLWEKHSYTPSAIDSYRDGTVEKTPALCGSWLSAKCFSMCFPDKS